MQQAVEVEIEAEPEVQQAVEAEVEAQPEQAFQVELVEIVPAPYRAQIGSGTRRSAGGMPQPRAQTFASVVSHGAHINSCLAAELHEVAQQWAAVR